MWTFSFCSNARSFDRPTVAKPGKKIKAPIFIRRKGAEVFNPALAAGGSLMAYKCLSLCGLFSFFKGFGENLFHAGFQLIQIEGRSLHGKTENFLLFRVREIALIVLKHSFPCVLPHLFARFSLIFLIVQSPFPISPVPCACSYQTRGRKYPALYLPVHDPID